MTQQGDGSKHPYENETSQKLRREMLRNDRSTLLDHARAHADDAAGGRFKKEMATEVTGVPQYPRLPATSPFASDPVPPEEPLGFSVDDMVPVGTATEVEASIADEAAMAPTESSPVVETEAASSAPSLRRRA